MKLHHIGAITNSLFNYRARNWKSKKTIYRNDPLEKNWGEKIRLDKQGRTYYRILPAERDQLISDRTRYFYDTLNVHHHNRKIRAIFGQPGVRHVDISWFVHSLSQKNKQIKVIDDNVLNINNNYNQNIQIKNLSIDLEEDKTLKNKIENKNIIFTSETNLNYTNPLMLLNFKKNNAKVYNFNEGANTLIGNSFGNDSNMFLSHLIGKSKNNITKSIIENKKNTLILIRNSKENNNLKKLIKKINKNSQIKANLEVVENKLNDDNNKFRNFVDTKKSKTIMTGINLSNYTGLTRNIIAPWRCNTLEKSIATRSLKPGNILKKNNNNGSVYKQAITENIKVSKKKFTTQKFKFIPRINSLYRTEFTHDSNNLKLLSFLRRVSNFN